MNDQIYIAIFLKLTKVVIKDCLSVVTPRTGGGRPDADLGHRLPGQAADTGPAAGPGQTGPTTWMIKNEQLFAA